MNQSKRKFLAALLAGLMLADVTAQGAVFADETGVEVPVVSEMTSSASENGNSQTEEVQQEQTSQEEETQQGETLEEDAEVELVQTEQTAEKVDGAQLTGAAETITTEEALNQALSEAKSGDVVTLGGDGRSPVLSIFR